MLDFVFHRHGEIIFAVAGARDERDRAAGDKLADENYTAPPGVGRFSPHVETQIHFFEIAVQRDGKSEETRVEKEKSDHTEKGLIVFVVDLCTKRNQRREQARIDDVIQHRKVTPVCREKWLHVKVRRSWTAATELIADRLNTITRAESRRVGDWTEIGLLGGVDPVGLLSIFEARV